MKEQMNNQVIGNQFDDLLGDVAKVAKNDYIKIDVRNIIVEWDKNVRRIYDGIEELAENIKEHGLKDPLKVSTIRGTDQFRLVDGHRRYKAIMLLLEQGHPVKIVNAMKVSDNPETQLSEMLITGVHKKTLHPVEQAEAFKRLQNFGWTVEKITTILGESATKNTVYRYLKLADAPEKIKQRCLAGEISHDTVIKIIEKSNGDYETIVRTVEDAIENNTVTNEDGTKEVKKVKTKDVFGKKEPKSPKEPKITFLGQLQKASDEMFEQGLDTEILDELLSIEAKGASVEDIIAFFGQLKK